MRNYGCRDGASGNPATTAATILADVPEGSASGTTAVTVAGCVTNSVYEGLLCGSELTRPCKGTATASAIRAAAESSACCSGRTAGAIGGRSLIECAATKIGGSLQVSTAAT